MLRGLPRQTILGQALRYGLAVAAPLASLAAYWAAAAWAGAGLPPFITFYPAVMLAAVLGGFGPGFVATISSALLVDYWILAPLGQFTVASPIERLGW